MDVAAKFAALSTAQKLKVGAIVVDDTRIISIGYNGTPSGWDNDCEYYDPNSIEDWMHPRDYKIYGKLITKDEVIHAERNALDKLAKSNDSSLGATMFTTHTPCIECAKSIYNCGISTVYIKEKYTANKGCGEEFLIKAGVNVEYLS